MSGPPRLMLTTVAPCSAAHCMPARIHDSAQPNSTHTLPSSSCAPGATPVYRPLEAAPVPAMVEATWVPWPTRSRSSSSPSVKLRRRGTWPARSGWVASMPVSSTATVSAGAVEPGRPGRRRADLRHAHVERRLAQTVEPDRGDARPEAFRRDAGGGAGEAAPHLRGGVRPGAHGERPHRGQVPRHLHAGGGQRRPGRGPAGGDRGAALRRPVLHDQRQVGAPCRSRTRAGWSRRTGAGPAARTAAGAGRRPVSRTGVR